MCDICDSVIHHDGPFDSCVSGDVITAKFPMIVHAETIQDSRPKFSALKVGRLSVPLDLPSRSLLTAKPL